VGPPSGFFALGSIDAQVKLSRLEQGRASGVNTSAGLRGASLHLANQRGLPPLIELYWIAALLSYNEMLRAPDQLDLGPEVMAVLPPGGFDLLLGLPPELELPF
jgi:hypothetical protein